MLQGVVGVFDIAGSRVGGEKFRAGSSARCRDEVAGAVSCGEVVVTARARALSEVFVIIRGFEGENESICAMRVSGKGVGGAGHVAAATSVDLSPTSRVEPSLVLMSLLPRSCTNGGERK